MTTEKKKPTWPDVARSGGYLARGAAAAPVGMDYAIDGLLPMTGTSVWFGQGSAGKTQLLLWMAAHLAAPEAAGVDTWLGQPIRKRGQILILSAEDLREHLFVRLASIVRGMAAEDKAAPTIAEVCERIHVLPFLSLELDEFPGSNPALFRQQGSSQWQPTETLSDVEGFIASWNGAEGRNDEDRIIGVVMDSAVSMAGFDLANAEATTNFLFHLNRTSRRQKVFWAIIGHTPKSASASADDPQVGAVGRLRGAAMWSTTPRTVIEVRVAGGKENIADIAAAYPGIARRDIVFVTVVKANSQHADFSTRMLRRLEDGAFEDLSARFEPEGRGSPDAAAELEIQQRAAIIELIREISGGEPAKVFRRPQLQARFLEQQQAMPVLAGIDAEVVGAKASARNLAGWLRRLDKEGVIKTERNGTCKIKELPPADG